MTMTDPDFEWADDLAKVKLANPHPRGEENLVRAYTVLRARVTELEVSLRETVESLAEAKSFHPGDRPTTGGAGRRWMEAISAARALLAKETDP